MSISSRDVQSGLSAASATDEMELAKWHGGVIITSQNLVNQSTRVGNGADVGYWSMEGGLPNVEATTRAW